MGSQSPFIDVRSFEVHEAGEDARPHAHAHPTFLSVYEPIADGEAHSPEEEDLAVFLNELYDDEFDDVLYQLAAESTSLLDAYVAHEVGGEPFDDVAAERFLNEHFAPLAAESRSLIERVELELNQRNVHALTDQEIDELIDRQLPSTSLSPTFDEFLKGVRKKLKRAAKKAVSVAKKGAVAVATGGLSLALGKLKGLVKPLLKRVIQTAIGRLPADLQPIARTLAAKAPFLREASVDLEHEHHGAACEIASVQHEFDLGMARLLLAPSEVALQHELALLETDHHDAAPPAQADLHRARERFVAGLRELEEGDDPSPLVEEFVPAILPALKIGIRLAGRKRVVHHLAKLLGRLIQRFVGPKHTPALSRALVDVGLRAIQLETDADRGSAAADAVAATIEDSVRRVADLPDHVLDDAELFEGMALEAFEHSASNNLPPMLTEATYLQRPDLSEARQIGATWARLPRLGRKRFKKLTRKFRTRLSPHKLADVQTFGDVPMEEFLEEELGVTIGEEVDAVVHLYEAIAGTSLADIARLDDDAPGLGTVAAVEQLHPLTREAAAVLLGEPRLGRDVDPARLADAHTVLPGQRFYYLEVPGRRPLQAPSDTPGRGRTRRPTQTTVVLDFPANEIRVRLFLSEVRAQSVAVGLRQRAHVGVITTSLRRYVERGLRASLSGAFTRLRIVHGSVTPGRWASAMKGLPSVVPDLLRTRLQEWVLSSLAKHLQKSPEAFVAAADEAVDGVTAVVTISAPPAFAQLRQALKGGGVSLAGMNPSGQPGSVKVVIRPGFADG